MGELREGCLCQECGRRYRIDIMLSDGLWARICHGMNLLCPGCIAQELEALGVFGAYRLEEIP